MNEIKAEPYSFMEWEKLKGSLIFIYKENGVCENLLNYFFVSWLRGFGLFLGAIGYFTATWELAEMFDGKRK